MDCAVDAAARHCVASSRTRCWLWRSRSSLAVEQHVGQGLPGHRLVRTDRAALALLTPHHAEMGDLPRPLPAGAPLRLLDEECRPACADATNSSPGTRRAGPPGPLAVSGPWMRQPLHDGQPQRVGHGAQAPGIGDGSLRSRHVSKVLFRKTPFRQRVTARPRRPASGFCGTPHLQHPMTETREDRRETRCRGPHEGAHSRTWRG